MALTVLLHGAVRFRRRSIGAQQAGLLELPPQVFGDGPGQHGGIVAHLGWRHRAGNDGGDGGVGEGELQRRRAQRDPVAVAHRGDAGHLVMHLGRRRAVVVGGAGHRAGGEDAGGVGGSLDDADVVLDAVAQLVLEQRLLDQRVGHRQQHVVERDALGEPRDGPRIIDPRADGADLGGRLQLLERPPAALPDELIEVTVGDLRRGVLAVVQVVDRQQVHPVDAEPLQAVLVGAHDAAVGEVPARFEGQPVAPAAEIHLP